MKSDATWKEAMAWALENLGVVVVRDANGAFCWIEEDGTQRDDCDDNGQVFIEHGEPYTLLPPPAKPEPEREDPITFCEKTWPADLDMRHFARSLLSAARADAVRLIEGASIEAPTYYTENWRLRVPK